MIQVQTWLNTIDNSGARFVECIHTIGGFNRKYAYPGDFILVSVKQLRLVRKVKIGQIHLALITRTRKNVYFKDGTYSNSASAYCNYSQSDFTSALSEIIDIYMYQILYNRLL